MSTARTQAVRNVSRSRLGLFYLLAVLGYVLAVVILSYREGLTAAAKIAALMLAGLFLLRTVTSSERIFFPIEYKLLIGWFVAGVISSAFSSEPATALPRIVTLMQIFPVAFIISNIAYWNGTLRFYWLFIVAATVVSCVVTLASVSTFSSIDGRLFGTLGNANAFAALLAAAVAICVGSLLGIRVLAMKVVALALAGLFFYMLSRTGSRMGMMAAISAVVMVTLCYQSAARGKGLSRYAAVIVFGVGLLAAMIYFLSSSEFADRLQAFVQAVRTGDFKDVGDMSLQNRARLYGKALELMLGSPLIGVGLDVFRTAGLDFRMIGNNSHSNYMEVLASTGLLGAPLYFGMYYSWWSRLIKARGALHDPRLAMRFAIAAALATIILVFDVAWVTYYQKLVWLVLAGLIAEVHLLSREVRSASRVPGRSLASGHG
ncbi:hypothetical protein GPROT2_00134 [Gammaproteobacteria bacterium]|nr:O-antigen ligase family protein [Gammaproteobacteria bacterium]CAG0938061.1 hypothetical protein GPROT2_00134 [Gammaproteobacteria bacterium]